METNGLPVIYVKLQKIKNIANISLPPGSWEYLNGILVLLSPQNIQFIAD